MNKLRLYLWDLRFKYFPELETANFNASDDIEGWFLERREDEAKIAGKKPILYFLLYTLPQTIQYRLDNLNDLRLFFKNWWRPHNIVKCRYLDQSFHDKDLIMEHCIFELLAQFVEKEKPWEFTVSQKEITQTYDEELLFGANRAVIYGKLKQAYNFYNNLHEILDNPALDGKRKELWNKFVSNVFELRGRLWT